jgi:HEAT repeat protein
MDALGSAVLVLVAGSMLFLLVLVGRRSWIGYRAGRRDAAVAALRPAAIELIEDAGDPPPLRGLDAEVFAELLGGYSLVVRGEPRERIAAYFESTGAVDEQLALLGSRRAWRRATAAFTLGDMGSPHAVPALLGALDDKRRAVRAAAARSLGRIGSEAAIEPLITAGVERRIPRDVASLALFDIGTPAVPRLLELTRDDEPLVRAASVELVGYLGNAGDSGPLPAMLRDTSADVRAAAAGSLGRLGASTARDALVDALDDRVPGVRVAASRALGQIGGRRALDGLLRVARTDEHEPAASAAQAAARIDPALVVHAAAQPDAGPYLREAADFVEL